MGIKKIVGLTLCLVRLHNFCIDNRAKKFDALLDGGNHNDDTSRPYRDSDLSWCIPPLLSLSIYH
jgi:hypothetical protein